MRIGWKSLAIIIVAFLGVLAVAACGSSANNNTNTASTNTARSSTVSTSAAATNTAAPASPVATVASPTSAAATATAASTGTAAAAATSAAGHNLIETTTDNKFSQTSFTIQAGQQYTLTQINKGQAIHDWHVLDVKSTDGATITTPLTQPGKNSSVTFTIAKPGTYHFHCDVHPTEMTGTLIVK